MATPDADPFSGAIFVFRNRLRTALKLLVYDGQDFWPDGTMSTCTLQAHELQLLPMAGDPRPRPALRRPGTRRASPRSAVGHCAAQAGGSAPIAPNLQQEVVSEPCGP